MSVDEGLSAWVREALEPLGTVTMRKMMGGAILYLDGIVFALLDDDALWFKADPETDALWDAEGCERFSMAFKDGRIGVMNYRRAPPDVYDDPDALQHWARLAAEAGARTTATRKPRKRKRSAADPQ
ncbi:TfoX/Sxy family protein [Allosphingosinicella deserti]|uniref:Competence protein TfoX n=1 Tax=Allosphingosinicella deserti TaxID=2116704 RepID=A0A2P7QFE3_9SPHN|nr:TfoX/Sxy family protein [Sphingomonas deserti]PSJ36645.1 competence protein TfoX [Sphingomonas deserti]